MLKIYKICCFFHYFIIISFVSCSRPLRQKVSESIEITGTLEEVETLVTSKVLIGTKI